MRYSLVLGWVMLVLCWQSGLVLSAVAQEIVFHKVIRADTQYLYLENQHYCPCQCRLRLSAEMRREIGKISPQLDDSLYISVPARSGRVLLMSLPAQVELFYGQECYLGSPYQMHYNPDIPLALPHAPDKRYPVIQGYNGWFSHRHQFALDFKMPQGSTVCAVDDGVVIRSKSNSGEGGRRASFAAKANYIQLYHPHTGLFSKYYHLQQHGVLVAVGDTVRQGQAIGLSGNTGWSTTPHLHFVVEHPVYMGLRSIPTRFYRRTKQGDLRVIYWNTKRGYFQQETSTLKLR